MKEALLVYRDLCFAAMGRREGGCGVCYREGMMTSQVSFVMGKTFRYIPWTFVVAF